MYNNQCIFQELGGLGHFRPLPFPPRVKSGGTDTLGRIELKHFLLFNEKNISAMKLKL